MPRTRAKANKVKSLPAAFHLRKISEHVIKAGRPSARAGPGNDGSTLPAREGGSEGGRVGVLTNIG